MAQARVVEQWRRSDVRARTTAMLETLISRSHGFRARSAERSSAAAACGSSSPAAASDEDMAHPPQVDSEPISYEMARMVRDGLNPPGGFPTTLMVLNVPAACTYDVLLQEWPMDGTWDLLYLPMFAGGKRCIGYAFVNFVSEQHAATFFLRWEGQALERFPMQRRLQIIKAHVQGLYANVHELQRKSAGRVRSRRCRPIILIAGQRFDLDAL